jgi:hypothetical protein
MSINSVPSPQKFIHGAWPWILTILLISAVSLILSWVSNQFSSLQGWGAFFGMSLLAGGMLWVGLWLLRREKLPAWLVKLVIAGALLRLAFGAVWFVALPVWGHGTEAEKAGYVMADAANRDKAAWKLAQSEKPLWSAFQNNRATDQYGGLLFLSAVIYRILGGPSHHPLLIVLITASISALAIAYTWAFTQQAWNRRIASLAAWMIVIFPEAILMGSSQMREAFTITLGIAAFYGLLIYQKERRPILLTWLIVPLLLYLPFSPPFAAMVVGMVGILAAAPLLTRLPLRSNSWRLGLTILIMAALAMLGLWLTLRQFTPAGMNNPLEMLAWWLRKSANLQALFSKHASGWIQKTFKMIPEWAQLPLLVGYGVLQPFLPAALVVGSQAPIWPWIIAWRAIGWTLLLILLVYSPFLAFRRHGDNQLARMTSLAVWLGILIASFRGGGDMWDNPRYRSAFLGLQVSLAAWAWFESRRIADPWLRRFGLGIAAILAWFIPWYMRRYSGLNWPINDLFQTIAAGLISAALLILGDWILSRRKNLSQKPPG